MVISRLLPPVGSATATSTVTISKLFTKLSESDGDYVCEYVADTAHNCSVTSATADGISTIVSSISYPQNALQYNIDFYLRFSTRSQTAERYRYRFRSHLSFRRDTLPTTAGLT
jgi:HKD family nuclease